MSYVMRFVRSVPRQNLSFQPISLTNCLISNWRNIRREYADKPKADKTTKQIMVKGTEDLRVRVRRARPADVPRVLRFVREYSRLVWPGEDKKPAVNNHVVLSDYVTRTLAQGHSMLAEQQEAKLGWSRIRGVALCSATCPWDAAMLEKWARCVKCARSKKLMLMTAHCLRAPGLHDKYEVHNIMQIILIVPPTTPKASEITQLLAKNSINRGRDLGFPVLRFDVSDDSVAKVLDKLQLTKEYEFNHSILPTALKVQSEDKNSLPSVLKEKSVTVYTAFTSADKSLTKLK